MIVHAVLEWGILAASLFNIVLLLWLAITVLFNGHRRGWGGWVTVVALCAGALFFLVHAVIISVGFDHISPGVLARWPFVWGLGFLLPFAWYVVMLWYGGFWANPRGARHYLIHWGALFLLGAITVMTIFAAFYYQLSITSAYSPTYLLYGPTVAGVSMMSFFYALLVCICTAMALDILVFPVPSSLMMGDIARRRARGWLIATSLILLTASMIIGGVLVRVAPGFLDSVPGGIPLEIWRVLIVADLLITLLISLSIVLLGQAIVIFELFTDSVLPRHGLRRQWHTMVLIGALFAVVMALAQVGNTPQIINVLSITILLAVAFALHHWRSHTERERYISNLRPFTAGPRVTEALQQGAMPDVNAGVPFYALCEQLLRARWASLSAIGPFSALVTPLVYPQNANSPGVPSVLLSRFTDQSMLCLDLEPGSCGEAAWAVPLWGARGLIGVLLLGEKRSGELYTREEMEVARAVGERLIDTLAGAQMARRLLQVQRSRLTDDQLADHRARRVIHDDILPQIHAMMLAMSADRTRDATVTQLSEIHHSLAAVLREMPVTATLDIVHHGLTGAFRAFIERDFAETFINVEWHISPEADARARTISPLAAEVVFGAACEAIRNAARYARGSDPNRPVSLTVTLADTVPLSLIIADDGVGMANAAPSVGSGQGVLLHSAMMAIIGGAWNCGEMSENGTTVILTVPEEGVDVPASRRYSADGTLTT